MSTPLAGAVYLFAFDDASFNGGTLMNTFGKGYQGASNIDVPLDLFDRLGTSVALNAAGDLLAAGAIFDGGSANARFQTGAVYLFTGVTETGPLAQSYAYGQLPGDSITLRRSALQALLSQGTAVTLQASNDITLDGGALVVDNVNGAGGALTLQAGRSILLNHGITTDNANLTLIANDTLANGVVNAQRDAGAAVVTMAPGTRVDAGTGIVTIEMRNGAGKTQRASGDILLGQRRRRPHPGPPARSDRRQRHRHRQRCHADRGLRRHLDPADGGIRRQLRQQQRLGRAFEPRRGLAGLVDESGQRHARRLGLRLQAVQRRLRA